MRAKIMLGILIVGLGTAFGVAKQFAGEPMPSCKPGVNCPVGTEELSGDPIPICLPGKPCLAAK